MTEAILVEHLKALRASGAPHQQPLAQAIEDVLKTVEDPLARVNAATALLADRDRQLVEATAERDRAEARIQTIAGARDRYRDSARDAAAASNEAFRHRDEAQAQVKALEERLKAANGTVESLTTERNELAGKLADMTTMCTKLQVDLETARYDLKD